MCVPTMTQSVRACALTVGVNMWARVRIVYYNVHLDVNRMFELMRFQDTVTHILIFVR